MNREEWLQAAVSKLRPVFLDHSALVPVKENKPQTTRMRKCECEQCGFLVRLTQKWLDVGQPICPAPGHGAMKADLPKEEEGE